MYVVRWRQRDAQGEVHAIACAVASKQLAQLTIDAIYESLDVSECGEPLVFWQYGRVAI